MTRSIQDYLKVIYELTQSGAPATTTVVAQRLAVSPASVTGMLQKLAVIKRPLVAYRKHQGVTLTRAGKLAALEVIRRHRLIETWLVKSLGYSWDTVHGEAEILEHAISDDFERRISAALGNPARDPHGDPIPSAKLTMPKEVESPLSTLLPSQEAQVCRVEAREPDFLRYLAKIGLGIGASLRILDVSRYDHVTHLRVIGRAGSLVLGPAITSRVYVEHVRSRDTIRRRPSRLKPGARVTQDIEGSS